VSDLDIVIPAYNEGSNIIGVLKSLDAGVRTSHRILIAYDREDDDTLPVVRAHKAQDVVLVKNEGSGVFDAVTTAFRVTTAPAILVWPADDSHNANRIDLMVDRVRSGCEIVVASRFMPGGRMVGCPWVKSVIVRSSAFVLHRIAGLPTHDPSNGLRMFSRRVIRAVPLESTDGFTYSIELLVKAHRLGWRICELPFEWHERVRGRSRFRVLGWLPAYFVWFRYAFATTYLRRGPETVRVLDTESGLG
jgi:glycosyltransferase involved in cell wall biosynthesis